jgi:F0F1-type ATP synthase epsilon subunit
MLARFTTVSEEEFEQMAEAAERDEELDEANREQWAKLAALKAEMENNN